MPNHKWGSQLILIWSLYVNATNKPTELKQNVWWPPDTEGLMLFKIQIPADGDVYVLYNRHDERKLVQKI